MKLYILANSYCAEPKIAGIQGIHSAIELMNKYTSGNRDFDKEAKVVKDFVNNHKTVALLNSGRDHVEMGELLQQLGKIEVDGYNKPFKRCIPFMFFDEPGMNNTITSIALICSTEMVEDMSSLRAGLSDYNSLSTRYGPDMATVLMDIAYMRSI